MGSSRITGLVVGACAVALSAFAPAPAMAGGPVLTVPKDKLDAALTCTANLAEAKVPPVLLTPAFSSADASYGWNYLARLPKIGVPTCSITVDDSGYGDLQTTAEYVVVRSAPHDGDQRSQGRSPRPPARGTR